MFIKNQMFVSCVLYCLFQLSTVSYGFELNHLRTKTVNHRIKRDSGIIPFRPLFVYRQQQKEKQAKWKLQEAQKLHQQLLQQQLLQQHIQLQNQQNSIVDYYAKYPLNTAKLDYTNRPTYPVYPNYQTDSAYQTNAVNQLNQYYQNYPQNAYGTYPTFSSSYLDNGGSYANQDSLYYNYDDTRYYQ